MTKLISFGKSFAKPFAIIVLVIGFIGGAAMALEPAVTNQGLGIAVWSLSFILIAGWIASGVTGVYVKNYKLWKESDKGYMNMVLIYYGIALVYFIMTIVSFVIH